MIYIPLVAAALFTVILAHKNMDEIYRDPELASPEERLEGSGGIKIKGILKYFGVFILTGTVLYLLIIVIPVVIIVIMIAGILSSLSFGVFFRI